MLNVSKLTPLPDGYPPRKSEGIATAQTVYLTINQQLTRFSLWPTLSLSPPPSSGRLAVCSRPCWLGALSGGGGVRKCIRADALTRLASADSLQIASLPSARRSSPCSQSKTSLLFVLVARAGPRCRSNGSADVPTPPRHPPAPSRGWLYTPHPIPLLHSTPPAGCRHVDPSPSPTDSPSGPFPKEFESLHRDSSAMCKIVPYRVTRLKV